MAFLLSWLAFYTSGSPFFLSYQMPAFLYTRPTGFASSILTTVIYTRMFRDVGVIEQHFLGEDLL